MHTVMFVDDEPWAVIDIMHSIPWNALGFSTANYYEKPREALEAIVREKPDLVFTDIRMPVMDGFELIRQCREAGSESDFIILSSYSDFELAQQAIRSAVLDYCLKPVNPEALTEMLREISLRLDDKKAADSDLAPEWETPELSAAGEQFERILDYIKANFHNKLLLHQIATQFNFNKNYICYLFKKHAGTTFTTYLTGLRIGEAKRLLRGTELTLGEIAARTGFMDYYYFNRVFKAECGITPSRYRKQQGDGI